MQQEFSIDRSKLLYGAIVGLGMLLFGFWVIWLAMHFVIPADWDLPFFDGEKASWLFVILMALMACLPMAVGIWATVISWRNWKVRIHLGDEGLVSYDQRGQQTIWWHEVQAFHELRIHVQPSAHSIWQLATLPFAEGVCHRVCNIELKDGSKLEISDLKGQNILLVLLAVQAQKLQIPWVVTEEQLKT